MFERAPGDFVGARELLDTAPDAMIVVGRDGIIVYANRQTETLFGHASADLCGQSLQVLVPTRFHGAHGSHVNGFFAAPSLRAMGSGLELFGVRHDGTEMPIEVSLSPLHGVGGAFVSASIRDVSERKATQAAAKLSEERLTSAVESMSDGVALFDADDRLFLCNSSYRALLGDTVGGPVLGLQYADVLRAGLGTLAFPNDAARNDYKQARLRERKGPGTTFDVVTTDGRNLHVSNRRTAEGGIVQCVSDVTEAFAYSAELGRARVAADAGSAAKSEFLASMSHELRTPLNAILGFAQLSQRDKKEPLTARHRARVAQILKGGGHLLRLIDDVLDLSRIEAGGVTISNEPVDARALVDEVVVTLGPMAETVGLSVSVLDATEARLVLFADRTRLLQVLMNFGSNAIKYNRQGGTVAFEIGQGSGGTGRITVRDTGIGVPSDKQHTLFQPFQRAGQEAGPIEGTGIGLAISKRLASLMDGTVGFRSLEAGGSEFWVELPLHTLPAPNAALLHARSLDSSKLADATRARVLYIEDNPDNVIFMEDLLDVFAGIQLTVAPNAELGIQLAAETAPHVIIMDINLPGMSGLDALKVLQEQATTRGIPVIALTAAASDRDRRRGEQAGFYRYLTKPVQVEELERVLAELLDPLHDAP